ncbi:MAG TPA: PfkB family carbohydrate kinase [Chloroflexia bacterium]|nr:PfkB family carbohydrate kinase [Chloroflexia bacterium]
MQQIARTPDYLVLGHVAKDLAPDGEGASAGGTVIYSAITAQRLGLQAAVVTACAQHDESLLDEARAKGVWVHVVSSPATTTFRNTYTEGGKRTQLIFAQASTIQLDDVPTAWRSTPIVHLGPIAQELPAGIAGALRPRLLGVTPQGWLRQWDASGAVSQSAWPIPPELRNLPSDAFLVMSIEDLGYDPDLVHNYVNLSPLVAVTQGPGEAFLYGSGGQIAVPACPAEVADATGAGDVFATALFVRYSETGNLRGSALFAHAAAACAIEGTGTSTLPDREAVEARLKGGE